MENKQITNKQTNTRVERDVLDWLLEQMTTDEIEQVGSFPD